MKIVRAAMIGDVVGEPGLKALENELPAIIREYQINFVTVNGENAADGFGMIESDYHRIIAAGADVVTSGNHIWEKREFWPILENEKNMLRPANYPSVDGVPGRGFICAEKDGFNWLVINLQGRELMNSIDCPFICFDKILSINGNKQPETQERKISAFVIVDFHAESSREKEALAYYTDGRASIIAGTHTHVQTADERILPKGTAYITDLGMTGVTDSVIGMEPNVCLERSRKQIFYQMKLADDTGNSHLNGIIAEINADNGMAVSVKRIGDLCSCNRT